MIPPQTPGDATATTPYGETFQVSKRVEVAQTVVTENNDCRRLQTRSHCCGVYRSADGPSFFSMAHSSSS